MALKSRVWFLGRCYEQVSRLTRLAHLADRALQLGFGSEKTQGHILQACGAAQKFLTGHPAHKSTIRAADPTEPFNLKGEALTAWLKFFKERQGRYNKRFGYNWNTLRGYLTPKYGGRRKGGGGGNNEFEIVLRLMAEML